MCVQECIDPALLGGNKFDLRIYVLLESVLPLKAHLCRSAMLRKCMEVGLDDTDAHTHTHTHTHTHIK